MKPELGEHKVGINWHMKLLKNFTIIFLVTFLFSHLSHADEGNTIYSYYRSTMTPTKLSLDDLNKITFSNNSIQMWSQSGMSEISFDDFLLFTFSKIEHPYVSVVEPTFISQDIHVHYESNARMVCIESGVPLNGMTIYDLQGRIAAQDASTATRYHLSLATMNSGIYLIKVVCKGKSVVNKIVL